MDPFELKRLGIIMEPEPGNPLEVEGVLNPAVVRGPDGELYLFPRMVAKGNYSRIGIARVLFNPKGDPIGVQRIGIALEPEADYEKRPNGGGGCEDPRITFVEPLNSFVMTYTAFSAAGPRIALAVSADLLHWERLGLAKFAPYNYIQFNEVNNKDACIFPKALLSPHAHPSLVMLHRPLFPGTRPEDFVKQPKERRIRDHHECIWISYSHLNSKPYHSSPLPRFASNSPLALPQSSWERLKIGAGAPPIMSRHGWLLVYHGVMQGNSTPDIHDELVYAAGVMVLDTVNPHKILYRSTDPVLSPELPQERIGMVGDVVFPTGIDQRSDIGCPDRYDVYYGMADNRIGVAQLDLPDKLPEDKN
ncbi:glycosidase [Pedobacter sp. ASV28]|uniref:glycoside hydrolase family 130 protein n=1 Tax=Pedobacter sp. ASV28 TaxID=2795123 RepID=UPI0018EBD341|nr:glycosidase [Pedobacter sp. ASV28]